MIQTLDIRQNFFPEPNNVADAWQCQGCKRLIYNIEREGGTNYPAPGAPLPKYASAEHTQVCLVCFEMHKILEESSYWRSISKPRRTVKADGWDDYI